MGGFADGGDDDSAADWATSNKCVWNLAAISVKMSQRGGGCRSSKQETSARRRYVDSRDVPKGTDAKEKDWRWREAPLKAVVGWRPPICK
uniref:Uncharacterized protein n=1 Tax=Plectus sambesii TaxID=2011161 RepID=A0A914WHS4_9BILA